MSQPQKQTIHHVSLFGRMMLPLARILVGLWWRTLRFRVDEGSVQALSFHQSPLLVLMWHNRLFLTFWIRRKWRCHRPVCALVSASRDGAWLTALLQRSGVRSIRGSSHRFGREALLQVVQELKEGSDVAITPDGPRGPQGHLKEGAIIAARRAQVNLLLIGARYNYALRLRSWDRFYLPLPFSTVEIRACLLAPLDPKGEREEQRIRLEAILHQMSGEESPPVPV